LRSLSAREVNFFKRRNGRAIGKKNIQQTIVVVVEQRYAASHSFKRVPTENDTVPEGELDFRLIENVLELDRRLASPAILPDFFPATARWGCAA